jgi:pimeloyl-ACP methyl ester carboxylesterase
VITRLLQFEQATLSYTKTGNGTNVLFAFHGFGQNAQSFNKVSESLSDRYTIYSFDIFFHGNSQWGYHEQPLEKKFWNRLIQKLLSEESIQEFSVLGFSMGGKFALATLEGFPTHVKEVFLIAPDGVKTSMWYSLATYPVALRNLFKSTISKPQRFNAIANFAYRTRLIDKGILRFVESQMNTEQKRQRVYLSWVVFRHLSFNMTEVSKIINQQAIKLIVIVGRFDKIITSRNMTKLTALVPHVQLEVIEAGHNSVVDASVSILKNN